MIKDSYSEAEVGLDIRVRIVGGIAIITSPDQIAPDFVARIPANTEDGKFLRGAKRAVHDYFNIRSRREFPMAEVVSLVDFHRRRDTEQPRIPIRPLVVR